MIPSDFGLPDKFLAFRPKQLEAAYRVAASPKKHFLLVGPPGTGKSLLAATVQKIMETQMVYTCSTLQLQKQLANDFTSAVELKGRVNYPCLKGSILTAAQCTKRPQKARCSTERRNLACRIGCNGPEKAEFTCPCISFCPYERCKRAALNSDFSILNLPFFLSEANFVGEFSSRPFLVLDEADLLEDALRSFIGLTLTKKQIARFGLHPPEKITVISSWLEWSKTTRETLSSRLAALQGSLWTPDDLREEDELKRLLGKLDMFNQLVDEHWVFISSEDSWEFKPVLVSPYAEQFLWRHANKFLCMSATLLPQQWVKDSGVSDFDVMELPMTWPVENRRIYYRPVANLTHKNTDSEWPKLVAKIDEILDEFPKDRGLCHTVSYGLAKYIIDHSKHHARMVWHDSSKGRLEAVDKLRAGSGRVLVSPSFSRGLDLYGDLGRFVIIAKVPYANLGDKQVSHRLYAFRDGEMWYAAKAIRDIVQASGRVVRSERDFGCTFILDEQFEKVFKDWGWLFPVWWKEALVF